MKQKTFDLSRYKVKRIKDEAFGVNSIFFIFFRIFIFMSFAMIPVISHNIITFNHSASLEDQGKLDLSYKYIIAAQAIGYSQPMSFFSVSTLVLIIVNIMIFIRRSLDTFNKKNQPKDIINSGITYIFIFSILVSILFYIVMKIYAEVVIESI